MKSKLLTYVLITAVAAVWGVIFYRLFLATKSKSTGQLSVRQKVKEDVEALESPDTFKLVLNYRDPFLGRTTVAEPSRDGAANRIATANASSPGNDTGRAANIIDWDFIKYSGYVINPRNKKMVAILSINNHSRMVSKGEVVEGVKLLENLKDSVRVSYRGKTKYITLR